MLYIVGLILVIINCPPPRCNSDCNLYCWLSSDARHHPDTILSKAYIAGYHLLPAITQVQFWQCCIFLVIICCPPLPKYILPMAYIADYHLILATTQVQFYNGIHCWLLFVSRHRPGTILTMLYISENGIYCWLSSVVRHNPGTILTSVYIAGYHLLSATIQVEFWQCLILLVIICFPPPTRYNSDNFWLSSVARHHQGTILKMAYIAGYHLLPATIQVQHFLRHILLFIICCPPLTRYNADNGTYCWFSSLPLHPAGRSQTISYIAGYHLLPDTTPV